jgi:formamidopyrimidine-DNA glycosylase
MPELPEVEVVRRGLERLVVGHTVESVRVLNARSTRRHLLGPGDFAARLTGRLIIGARRRGKYLWLQLDDGAAILGHLGMSGQLLVRPTTAPPDTHLRVVLSLDGDIDLRLVDQRTFGGLSVTELADDVPPEIAHIGLDPLDPAFDADTILSELARRRTNIKRALLDQTLVSGVGNIYADEALWIARLHYARPTRTLRRREGRRLLEAVTTVMVSALAEGGTSFDSLYVDVNGESGYFERSLNVYGREGEPCRRCGSPIRRDPFMNRSSYTCPVCQPRPRNPHW